MSANSERKEIINNGGESEKMIDRNENVKISDEAKNEKEENHTDEAHSRLSEIGENIIKTVKHGLDTLSSTITNANDDQGSSTQNRNSQNGDSHQSSSPTQNGDSHQSSSPTRNGDSHQSSSPTNLTETEH
ncbi:33123_t:CDS:2, partial [Gigaspora margarita]